MPDNSSRQNVRGQTRRPALVSGIGRQPVVASIRSGLNADRQPVVGGAKIVNPLQRQGR